MTWEDLVDKAKELGYVLHKDRSGIYLISGDVKFYQEGSICSIYSECGGFSVDNFFAWDRTPDQMYQIMLALE